MSSVLAIDTAAPRLQLALLQPDGAVDVSIDEIAQGHAELLFSRLDGLLGRNGLGYADLGRVAVTTLALTGADFSMAELRAQARWLRDRLSALKLVSRVDLFGIQDERIWLTFDRARLAQLGIAPNAVLNAIAEQNRILPAGTLFTSDGMRYPLEPSGDFRDVAAIGDVPVRTPSGAVVQVPFFVNVDDPDRGKPNAPSVDDRIRAWADTLADRHAYLKDRGIEYVVLAPPDKSSVYPEYLPGYHRRHPPPP